MMHTPVFAKARFTITGSREKVRGYSLVDGGMWCTVVGEELAERIGVEYTGLTVTLTFPGHKIKCREAIVEYLEVEGRKAPRELVAVCRIPSGVRELLAKQGVSGEIVIGVHTLERLGLAVDPVSHSLVEAPGVLMI